MNQLFSEKVSIGFKLVFRDIYENWGCSSVIEHDTPKVSISIIKTINKLSKSY